MPTRFKWRAVSPPARFCFSREEVMCVCVCVCVCGGGGGGGSLWGAQGTRLMLTEWGSTPTRHASTEKYPMRTDMPGVNHQYGTYHGGNAAYQWQRARFEANTVLLCNDVSHCLGANLESALDKSEGTNTSGAPLFPITAVLNSLTSNNSLWGVIIYPYPSVAFS